MGNIATKQSRIAAGSRIQYTSDGEESSILPSMYDEMHSTHAINIDGKMIRIEGNAEDQTLRTWGAVTHTQFNNHYETKLVVACWASAVVDLDLVQDWQSAMIIFYMEAWTKETKEAALIWLVMSSIL